MQIAGEEVYLLSPQLNQNVIQQLGLRIYHHKGLTSLGWISRYRDLEHNVVVDAIISPNSATNEQLIVAQLAATHVRCLTNHRLAACIGYNAIPMLQCDRIIIQDLTMAAFSRYLKNIICFRGADVQLIVVGMAENRSTIELFGISGSQLALAPADSFVELFDGRVLYKKENEGLMDVYLQGSGLSCYHKECNVTTSQLKLALLVPGRHRDFDAAVVDAFNTCLVTQRDTELQLVSVQSAGDVDTFAQSCTAILSRFFYYVNGSVRIYVRSEDERARAASIVMVSGISGQRHAPPYYSVGCSQRQLQFRVRLADYALMYPYLRDICIMHGLKVKVLDYDAKKRENAPPKHNKDIQIERRPRGVPHGGAAAKPTRQAVKKDFRLTLLQYAQRLQEHAASTEKQLVFARNLRSPQDGVERVASHGEITVLFCDQAAINSITADDVVVL